MDRELEAILATGTKDGYTPVEMAGAVKSWRNDTAKDIFGAEDEDAQVRLTATRQLDAEAQDALDKLRSTEFQRHYEKAFGENRAEMGAFHRAFEGAKYNPEKLQIEGVPEKNWKGIAQGSRAVLDSDIFDLPESGKNSTRGGSLMYGDLPIASYDTLHDGSKPKAVVRFAGEGDSPKLINDMIAAKKKELAGIPQSTSLRPESMDDSERRDLAVRKEISNLEDRLKKSSLKPLTIDLPDFTRDDVKARRDANLKEIAAQQEKIKASPTMPQPGTEDVAGDISSFNLRQQQAAEKRIGELTAENQRLGKEGVRYLQAEAVRQEILKPENRGRIPDQGLAGDFVRGTASLALNTGTAALVGLSGAGNEWATQKLPEQIEASAELQNLLPGAVPRHMEGGLTNEILTGAAESMPLTLAILATGGASAALGAETGALAPLVPMYASSYGAKYAAQIKQADDLDAQGFHEEASDLRRLANVAAHVSAGIETGTEMISKGHAPFRSGVTGGIKRAGATVLEEGPLEEGIGQIAQNIAAPITSAGVNQPAPLEGVATAVGAGMLSALPFGAATAFQGDAGRAQQAIADFQKARAENPEGIVDPELQQRAEQATAFLGGTPEERIARLQTDTAAATDIARQTEAAAHEAAMNNPAANVLSHAAEAIKASGAPDVSLTTTALEEKAGQLAVGTAVAEAERLEFGRPALSPQGTSSTPTTQNESGQIRQEGVPGMPQQSGTESPLLPLVQGGAHEGVAQNAPTDAGAAETGERPELRSHLPGQGQDQAGAVPGVRRAEGGDASPRLQQAAGGDVDVPSVPSAATRGQTGAVVGSTLAPLTQTPQPPASPAPQSEAAPAVVASPSSSLSETGALSPEGKSPHDQVMAAAEPLVAAIADKGEAEEVTARAKLLALAVDQEAPGFAGVQFVTKGGPMSLDSNTGRLDINVAATLRTMRNKDVKSAREWMLGAVDEEFGHRVSVDLEKTDTEWATDLDTWFKGLDDETKDLSRATYFAQVDRPGSERQFADDFEARHEAWRQYWTNAKVQKLVESRLSEKGQTALRKLIAAFVRKLRSLAKGANPQVKAVADRLLAKFEARAAELRGQAETKSAQPSAPVEGALSTAGLLKQFPDGEAFPALHTPPSGEPHEAVVVSPKGRTAYHGTPHKVDRFSTEKIGTGEGAAAYGWGLYFAEHPDVALDYRKRLTDWNASGVYEWNGSEYLSEDFKSPERHAVAHIFHNGLPSARKLAKEMLLDAEHGKPYTTEQGGLPYYRRFKEVVDSIKSKSEVTFTQGKIYTVEILAGDDSLIGWDKSLDEQPDKVRSALGRLIAFTKISGDRINITIDGAYLAGAFNDPKEAQRFLVRERGQWTGEKLYKKLPGTPREATEKLRSIGIKGIRYLDGGSRDAGAGTFNYVIFDENDIRITHENGKPVSAGEAMRSLSTAPPGEQSPEEASRQELASIIDQFKRHSQDEQTEGTEPDLPTDQKRTYQSDGTRASSYRVPLTREIMHANGERALRLSAQLSSGMNADFGKKVMAYISPEGGELEGIPSDPVMRMLIAAMIVNNTGNVAVELEVDPSDAKQPLREINSRHATALGLMSNLIWNPLDELEKSVIGDTEREVKSQTGKTSKQVSSDITKAVEDEQKEAIKKVAATQDQSPDWWTEALGSFGDKSRSLLTKIRDNLRRIAANKERLAKMVGKLSTAPDEEQTGVELDDTASAEDLRAEIDRLVSETDELLNELFKSKTTKPKKRTSKQVELTAQEVLAATEKARGKAIAKVVKALKPSKPAEASKRSKFVRLLTDGLEKDVLNESDVQDAFAQAYDLHGLTSERLEALSKIIRDVEALPDGQVKQTLMERAFTIINGLSPNSKVTEALYQNLLGGVLGAGSTMAAQLSGITRILIPFMDTWNFMWALDKKAMLNPKSVVKTWLAHQTGLLKSIPIMRVGVQGIAGGDTYGLGVSPSLDTSMTPTQIRIARLKPSELWKFRVGRMGWVKALLGFEPQTRAGKNIKTAALFPSWMASRSFNLIRSAEALTGSSDMRMAFRQVAMQHLMVNDGLTYQQAWNKTGDWLNPATNKQMWDEAMEQAKKEIAANLVSRLSPKQRAEEIVQDRLDKEHQLQIKNRHRELSALRNFKSEPLTRAGEVIAQISHLPTPVKSIFMFSRFFANVFEQAIFHTPLGYIHGGRTYFGFRPRGEDFASRPYDQLNAREKRIVAAYGSLENYLHYRDGVATASLAGTFVSSMAMVLGYAFWKWTGDDKKDQPPPFWITGGLPPASPYATGRQLESAGWWKANTLYFHVPGQKDWVAINYVQAIPQLAIMLSAIGNMADRVMFPEMLNFSVDPHTGERSQDSYKRLVEPMVNAIIAPASRSTYVTFLQAGQNAMEGNWKSFSKLLGRPIGETAAATMLGGPVARDLAKAAKPDVPKAAQDWQQAFISGIPFADAMGAETGLPMVNAFGEPISPFAYFPFFSASQKSSEAVKKAAGILNDIGITKNGPEEWMMSADVVELSHDGKKYLFSLDERAQVLKDIGQEFATKIGDKEDKIRGAKSYDDSKKIVQDLQKDARGRVLRKWRVKIRK